MAMHIFAIFCSGNERHGVTRGARLLSSRVSSMRNHALHLFLKKKDPQIIKLYRAIFAKKKSAKIAQIFFGEGPVSKICFAGIS